MWQTYLTVAVVAYLLGSIPFGYILVKLFLKQDIRQTGSGNIGATNVARSGKKGLAIATLLLDAAKGSAAVVVIGRYAVQHPARFNAVLYQEFGLDIADTRRIMVWLSLAAFFAILGHCFPIWLGFKGGKGVATAIGAFSMVEPRSAGLAFLVFLAIFGLTRYVSLSSVASAVLFPIFTGMINRESGSGTFAFGTAASAIIIFKHHANIRRLLNGTEPKFTTNKVPPDPIQMEKNA